MTGTEQAELLFLLMHSKEREDLKSKVFKCFLLLLLLFFNEWNHKETKLCSIESCCFKKSHKSKRNCSSIQIC